MFNCFLSMYIVFFPWFCGFIVKCFRYVPMYVLERYINKDYYYYYYYYHYHYYVHPLRLGPQKKIHRCLLFSLGVSCLCCCSAVCSIALVANLLPGQWPQFIVWESIHGNQCISCLYASPDLVKLWTMSLVVLGNRSTDNCLRASFTTDLLIQHRV